MDNRANVNELATEISIGGDFREFHEMLNARIDQRELNFMSYQDILDEMTEMFSGDIDATIRFVETEVSDTQFYWMSEVFDTIAKCTGSREFVDSLRQRLARVDTDADPDIDPASIEKCIVFAENALKS